MGQLQAAIPAWLLHLNVKALEPSRVWVEITQLADHKLVLEARPPQGWQIMSLLYQTNLKINWDNYAASQILLVSTSCYTRGKPSHAPRYHHSSTYSEIWEWATAIKVWVTDLAIHPLVALTRLLQILTLCTYVCIYDYFLAPDEEGLDQKTVEGAVRAIASADLLMIGGTSLAVYPAAGLIDYYRGNKLILVNKTPTPRDGIADLVVQGSIGEIFSQV